MRNDVVIYKADYVEIAITTAAGTTNLSFDNNQIRSRVEYRTGKHTIPFVSPDGSTSSLAANSGREFRFLLRIMEDEQSRYTWQQLVELTQGRYSATFTLNYFPSIFSTFDSIYTANMQSVAATLSNAVFEIKDHFADKIARGEANEHPNEVEVIVREGAGLSLIQLPMSALSIGSQAPCASVTFSGAGSATVAGATITAATTGVLMQWEFGSFATAQIAPGDDATAIANWIYVSGSWSATEFETRIVDNIDAGGTGISFSLGVLAMAYHGGHTGSSGVTIGLTIVEGSDSSSKETANLTLDRYDYIFGIFQTLPSAPHTLDMALRWWSVCRALYAWGSGASEEKDTVTTLTNNQHSFASSGGKASFVYSNIDVREIVIPREYITSFTPNNCANVEILALSEQFTPNTGGYYRTTYSNADDNDLPNLNVSSMSNLRELYAIACDIQQNTLLFGTHNNLEILSIDHQPVLTSSLLTEINTFSNLKKLRIGNDAGSGAISNPTISLSNLEELSATFCNWSGTLTMNTPNIKVFRIDDNAGLTTLAASSTFRSLEIASALNTSLALFVFNQAGVKEIGLPAVGTLFFFNLMTDLEKVEIENNSSITALDCVQHATVKYVRIDSCSNLTQCRLNITSAPVMEHFEISSCNWDYTNSLNYLNQLTSMTDVNNCTIILTNNGLTAAEVNLVLVHLDSISSGGYTGRSIDITTNTAPDTTSGGNNGVAAVASLQAKGFTVTTD